MVLSVASFNMHQSRASTSVTLAMAGPKFHSDAFAELFKKEVNKVLFVIFPINMH